MHGEGKSEKSEVIRGFGGAEFAFVDTLPVQ